MLSPSPKSKPSILPHTSHVVYIGQGQNEPIEIGGKNPIRIQSMTTTLPRDIDSTVTQIINLAQKGCELVRVTVPTRKDAECLKKIKECLLTQGIKIPIAADIHFTPNVALTAAQYVDKIRINPGNWSEKKGVDFEDPLYYKQSLERIKLSLTPLIDILKKQNKALRIGANHGSLSERIVRQYGDTPQGMVESVLEFARICQQLDFYNIIISIKASNTQLMINTNRLLVNQMQQEAMTFPIHLGVTEAGNGEDGRIKSAIGIGTLLYDGIGDTIRVSLTEDPTAEIPVAQEIVSKFGQQNRLLNKKFLSSKNSTASVSPSSSVSPTLSASPASLTSFIELSTSRSHTLKIGDFLIGPNHPIRVEMELPYYSNDSTNHDSPLEILILPIFEPKDLSLLESFCPQKNHHPSTLGAHIKGCPPFLNSILPYVDKLNIDLIFDTSLNTLQASNTSLASNTSRNDFELQTRNIVERVRTYSLANPEATPITIQFNLNSETIRANQKWLIESSNSDYCDYKVDSNETHISYQQLALCIFNLCQNIDFSNFLFSIEAENLIHTYRQVTQLLVKNGYQNPMGIKYTSNINNIIDPAVQVGSLLHDQMGEILTIDLKQKQYNLPSSNSSNSSSNLNASLDMTYNILQASRRRISKTEFISCPSCGRTLFDINQTTNNIKKHFGHLKGVKIAVMGCIVNGPGEMADADFGYVGASKDKVNLFVGKNCVKKNIPSILAEKELVELIKQHGKWIDPY